jgi:hypothetical protein
MKTLVQERTWELIITLLVLALSGAFGYIVNQQIDKDKELAQIINKCNDRVDTSEQRSLERERILQDRLVDMEKQIAAIEASRFTAADGQNVWQAIAELQATFLEGMAKMQAQIASLPREVPPAWFKELVDEMRLEIKAVHKLLEQHIVNHNNP